MGSVRHALFVASFSLLVAVGFGCSAGRNAGQPCAETPDCQSNLVCTEGVCLVAGTCPRSTPIACSDGSGCCPSTHPACCDDGNCYATSAECKEATCASAGKSCQSSTDCCTGLMCQTGTCKTPPLRMTWNISNSCLAGGSVQYRLFDKTDKRAVSNVFTLMPGKNVSTMVNCAQGHQICFGGRDIVNGWVYGIDVNGGESTCMGCCFSCVNGTVVFGPLVCP